MAKILLPYYSYQPRTTTNDHTFCFGRYGGHSAFFINTAAWRPPEYLSRMDFDLLVFGTSFMAQRWTLPHFARLLSRCRIFKDIRAAKVMIPQDEFVHSDALEDFIKDFGVSEVFTCAPEADWPEIYGAVDRKRVGFHQVMTGYLDDRTMARIKRLAERAPLRDIDVGYRAWKAAPYSGRHGQLKKRIMEAFMEEAPRRNLVADLSNRPEDMFLGDDWYRFLLRCKYTIGVEGGSSLHDPDGSIRRSVEEFLTRKPAAGFDEVEAACFPGLDGKLALSVISPRHLEACATRTCQVLLSGTYNGLLKPGIHYMELRRDFSNISEVIGHICRDDLRERIVERAYRDVVETRVASYEKFVELVVSKSLAGAIPARAGSALTARDRAVHLWMRAADFIARRIEQAIAIYMRLKPHLPPVLTKAVRAARNLRKP